MSYDPYNDPQNPVRKGSRPDLGSGNDGGDFMYGSGGRDIPVNEPEEGVVEGTSVASQVIVAWDPEGNESSFAKKAMEDSE